MSCCFPITEHFLVPKFFLSTHRLESKRGRGLSCGGRVTEMHRQHPGISRILVTTIIRERFYPELAEVEEQQASGHAGSREQNSESPEPALPSSDQRHCTRLQGLEEG